jgi:HK97 gp10 family phage protein
VQAEEGEAQPAEYFVALEFGTSHTPARPTARPAYDASRERAADAMGKKVVELIGRGT